MPIKISYVSDTHGEFHFEKKNRRIKLNKRLSGYIRRENPDVLVFAGDLAHGNKVVDFINGVLPLPHVAKVPYIVFVSGNHEYYHQEKSIDEVNDGIREDVRKWNENNPERELIFLDDSSATITHNGRDFCFLGGTLWTDYALNDHPVLAAQFAEKNMNDYQDITGDDGNKLKADELIRRHRKTDKFITDEILSSFEVTNIVVTHHQPTRATLPDDLKNSDYAPIYASDFKHLRKGCGADLWIAGHAHGARTAIVNETPVLCNTYGYPGQFESHQLKSVIIDKNFDVIFC